MRKVLKFVKGKRDDKKDHGSTSLGPFSMEISSPSPGTPGDDDHYLPFGTCGYSVDISGKDKTVTKLHKAAWLGNLDKLKVNLKKIDIDATDKSDRTPLHLACAKGHTNLVKFLLNNKAKITICDDDGKTPFLKAIECGHKDLVQFMLEKGVDMTTVDYGGNSGLHVASKQGFYEIASVLLKEGSPFESSNVLGECPLHIATSGEHKDLVELLLRYGASVNVVDRDHRTPLMFAARNGNMQLVQLFLEKGAQRRVMDSHDWTAEDYAIKNTHFDVAAELKSSPSDIQPIGDDHESMVLASAAISLVRRSVSPAINKVDDKRPELSDSDTWDSLPSEKSVKPVIPGLRLTKFVPPLSDDEISEESIHSPRAEAKDSEGAQDSPRSCVIPPPCKPPRSWDLIQSGMIDDHNNASEPRRRSLLTLGSLRSKRESFTDSLNGDSPSFHSESPQVGQGDAAQWIMSHSFSKQESLVQRHSFENVNRSSDRISSPLPAKVPSIEIEGKALELEDGGGDNNARNVISRDSLNASNSDSEWDSDASLPIDNIPVTTDYTTSINDRISPVIILETPVEREKAEEIILKVPSVGSQDKKSRQLLRVPPIDLNDEDIELGKEMEREKDKSDSSDGDKKTHSNKSGTLGRDGTLQGYDEVWETVPQVKKNLEPSSRSSTSSLAGSVEEPAQSQPMRSANLLVDDELLFPSPQLAEKSRNDDVFEPAKPMAVSETKMKNSTSLEFKKQTLATYLEGKSNNLKYESHSLDNLDDDAEGQPTRSRKHFRQMSVSGQPWKSEDLWQKPVLPPPPAGFDRMLVNKRISAELECYDKALRELAQVKIIKKPCTMSGNEPQGAGYSVTKNQKYLSLPRTNELIDEAFKEMGHSSVGGMQRGSLSLPRTVTPKDMVLELELPSEATNRGSTSLPRTVTPQDMMSHSGPVPPPRRRRSLRSRNRTDSDGELRKAGREAKIRPISMDAKLHIQIENKLKATERSLSEDSSRRASVGDENLSPNSSETPPPPSARRESIEKPIRRKRKTLLAMRGLNCGSLNDSQTSVLSVEESFEEQPFSMDSDDKMLPRQCTVIERKVFQASNVVGNLTPRNADGKPLQSSTPRADVRAEDGVTVVDGEAVQAGQSGADVVKNDVDLALPPPPEAFAGITESRKGSTNESHPSSSSELRFDRSESPENARYSPSDESGMSQNDITPQHSYPIPDSHFLWKQHLRDATAEKGRLQETAAVLGERTEKLKYELADAREASRSRDDVIALLQAQLAHMETMYTACLEDVSGYRLRLVNQEQELQLLKEICIKYEDEKEAAEEVADEERVSEIAARLREREREHAEMKLQVQKLEQDKQKSLEDISGLERKNEELEKRLDWSVSRIQVLSEEKGDASEKPGLDLSRAQDDARKWKEQYESCIVKLERMATGSDEVREDLREIVQKLEELGERDDSTWRDKMREEVANAVALLREEYAKVESLISKHNEQLEVLVQKLQRDLDESAVRQACLESQLGQTRNELVAARCSNQTREASTVIDALRNANAELRDQAEMVRRQVEIRDEDLRSKLASLNEVRSSESKLRETSTALEEMKEKNDALRYQVEALVIEKCVTDAKISSLQCVIEDGEALRQQLVKSQESLLVKASVTHSHTQTTEILPDEASIVQVEVLTTTVAKLRQELSDQLKPIEKVDTHIQTDMSLSYINSLVTQRDDAMTRLKISQEAFTSREKLATGSDALRSELERLAVEFGDQEEELKRTLVILKDTRNAAKVEFSRENSDLRQQLDEAKLQIQKYKEDLMESDSFFLEIPYPVVDCEILCPPPEPDVVAQRTPSPNDVKPRGSKIFLKGIQKQFSSVLTSIDDVNEDEMNCIALNAKESEQTESKEMESVEEPATLQRNNVQLEATPSFGRQGNDSSRAVDDDKTSAKDPFPAPNRVGNGITALKSPYLTHAPVKQNNVNPSVGAFKTCDVENDSLDGPLNPSSDRNSELRSELQLEKEKCKKNQQVIEKLRRENENLKGGAEGWKATNAAVFAGDEQTSPAQDEQSEMQFRRKVVELEQKVRDENSKRFALEVQVNKMRYDLQEKLRLEKELCVLRGRLDRDFVSRVELDQLRKTYDSALCRARHDAERSARNQLSSQLGQITTLMEKRQDEGQLQRNQLRDPPEIPGMRPEYREARLRLQSELAGAQATMEEEEKILRERRERRERESEERRETHRRKLVEKAYNVNLAPTRDKELGSKSVVCSSPQTVLLSADPAGPAVDYSALLRGELEKNLRKHSQELLNEQPSTSKSATQTSYDELDLYKKKYFLP